jgi:hypothetical protein
MANVYHALAAAQARVGFLTSVDAVQKQTYSTNNVAGVKRSREGILRDCVPKNYDGEPVQLMSRDSPSLLPSPRLKASSITSAMLPRLDVHNESSKYSQRRIAVSTPGPNRNPLLSLAHPIYGLPESLVSNMVFNGSALHLSLAIFLFSLKGVLAGKQNLVPTDRRR